MMIPMPRWYSPIMMSLYLCSTGLAMGFQLICTVISVLCLMWAPGRCLRDDDPDAALVL